MANNASNDQDNLFLRLFPTFARFASKGSKQGKKKGDGQSTKRSAKPRLPIVNLLPPRLELDKLKRSTRRGFILSAIGILGTAALLWTAQTAIVAISNQSLTAAQTQVSSANGRLDQLQGVKEYFASIQQRKDLIASKAGTPVDYVRMSDTILAALPAGAFLTNFEVKAIPDSAGAVTTDPAAAVTSACGPVTDPFVGATTPGIACLSISGIVNDRTQIGDLASSMKASTLFRGISVLQGTVTGGLGTGATFTGTAIITADAAMAVSSTGK